MVSSPTTSQNGDGPRTAFDAAGMYRWVASNSPTDGHQIARQSDVDFRLAHITDIHLPCRVDLAERVRGLVHPGHDVRHVVRKLEALGNDLGHEYRSRRILLSNLVKKALWGLHNLEVDHLAITGDIAHCGLAPEFMEMKAILEFTGWTELDRVILVLGNHDRFNLYETTESDSMETYFDVVSASRPRFKELGGGIGLLEIDSNGFPDDDAHFAEGWLPNTVGRIDPAVFAFLEEHQQVLSGNRIFVLLHHHISSDWYTRRLDSVGGLMDPIGEASELLQRMRQLDKDVCFLHGHKHEVMSPEYRFQNHQVSCPGAFFQTLRFNLIDHRAHGDDVVTQIAVRHTRAT